MRILFLFLPFPAHKVNLCRWFLSVQIFFLLIFVILFYSILSFHQQGWLLHWTAKKRDYFTWKKTLSTNIRSALSLTHFDHISTLPDSHFYTIRAQTTNILSTSVYIVISI